MEMQETQPVTSGERAVQIALIIAMLVLALLVSIPTLH